MKKQTVWDFSLLFPPRISAAGHLQCERDGPDRGGGGSPSAPLGGRQVQCSSAPRLSNWGNF